MKEPLFQNQIALYKRNEHLDLIKLWGPINSNSSILKTDLFEEATGMDAFLDILSQCYSKTFGIDISHVVVEGAKRRFPDNYCLVADVRNLPFKENSFDMIISNSTLDHLTFESVPLAVRELARVLKPNACLILTLDSKHNPLHLLSHWLRKWAGRYYVDRCYSISEVRSLLEKKGFVVTNFTAIYHVPPFFNFFAKKIHSLIGKRTNRLIKFFVNFFSLFGRLPTRFLTGRFIALRAIKPKTSSISEDTHDRDNH